MIFLLVLFLLILVGIFSFFHFSMHYSRAARLLSTIPGPIPLPVIGNVHLFTDRSQRGMWLSIRNMSELYYPIFKGWVFHEPIVFIRHPDDLEVVLSSQKSSYKDFPYKFMRPWLSDGLLTNKGDTYRNRRKLLTPVFHFKMLKNYINIINTQGDRLMKELRIKGKEFVIDILPLYTDASLNIVIEAAMGVDLDKTNKKFVADYKKAVEDMGSVVVYRIVRPYLPDWMINPLIEIGRKQRHALKILRDFTNKIIMERRTYHERNNTLQGFKEFTDGLESQDFDSVYTTGSKKKLLMLDLLLSAEKDGLIDNRGIREEVDTFLLGGTDTTRMVMAFFTMLLAEHKEIQDKARAEVCADLEESGGQTGIPELQKMPYLEQCIKESMRMYPVGSTIFRYTKDNIQLKNHVIPANTVVVCNIIDAHRDPNFWPEPEKFDPDRFLPELCRNRHPYSFIPFSAGPRNCIGQKFGMMELKVICARLLYNFYLEPVDNSRDMKLIGDIVLRPIDPFHTKFISIDRE